MNEEDKTAETRRSMIKVAGLGGLAALVSLNLSERIPGAKATTGLGSPLPLAAPPQVLQLPELSGDPSSHTAASLFYRTDIESTILDDGANFWTVGTRSFVTISIAGPN